jgi:uracil-DNA glycosylase family 4
MNPAVASEWERLEASIEACQKCPIHQVCSHKVIGEGSRRAFIMAVGEAPGEKEDHTGRPFVGKSGKFFRLVMRSAGYMKGDVYIANILKCRPPENRQPSEEEVGACLPFLWKQIELVNPRVIVAVGSVARSARQAVKMLRRHSIRAGLLRPQIVWPFPKRPIEEMLERVPCVLVPEMNVGQIRKEVERLASDRRSTIKGLNVLNSCMITAEQIVERVLSLELKPRARKGGRVYA